jgi:hypothetical protein
MTNPIPRNNMFMTPNSFDELTEILESIGSAEEKRMAWLGATLALNLANDLIENQLKVLANQAGEPV